MTTLTAPRLMTTAELLALPDDGMERYLIRGELRELPMTKRNRFHSGIEAVISYVLLAWLKQQPKPRGQVFAGEAGVILSHNPDSTVRIDVAYFAADVMARQTDDTTLIDGVPTLAVEILSPSDTVENIEEKVDQYLEASVPLVWLVNTHYRTVEVFRPGAVPELFNVTHELTAEPHLPGFRVAVAELFAN